MVSAIDKTQLKLIVLDTDLIKELNAVKRKIFKENPSAQVGDLMEEVWRYVSEMGYPKEVVRTALGMLNNDYARRTRCLDKTNTLVNNNKVVYFGTLTFKNDVLDKTTIETRRKYVSRYLKSISCEYIANIDFGDKDKNPQSNEREHYHCLIACENMPISWKYGFCKFEKVRTDLQDCKRTSKYICKLTNHAMKVERSGKARRLIYSRCNHLAPYWLFE